MAWTKIDYGSSSWTKRNYGSSTWVKELLTLDGNGWFVGYQDFTTGDTKGWFETGWFIGPAAGWVTSSMPSANWTKITQSTGGWTKTL